MKKLILSLLLAATSLCSWALVPIQLTNNSQYADNQIYIGIIGQNVAHQQMFVNLAQNSSSNAAFTLLNESHNTLHKTQGDWGYANIFVTLDQIANKTIYVDMCYGCRLFVAFGSPMYLHAFANGYAGADLNNPGDPNADLRWENIEFSYDENNVFFVNTTRVDAFQYPMGIDLYGNVAAGANNAHMRRGELQNYATIINAWNTKYGSTIYDQCKVNRITHDNLGPIIMQPSKIAAVKNANVFDSYINAIWSTFATKRLHASMGERGVWSGSVQNGVFVMTNDADPAQVAHISRPTTTDVIEGAGTFASGSEIDKAVQAQFCGAMNRGMIMLNKGDNELQNWGERSLFFTQNTWNEYVAFFHDATRSHDGYTYGFCYDDTFDQSATCATSHPSNLVVTIGGFTTTPGETVTPGEGNNNNNNENTGGNGGNGGDSGNTGNGGKTQSGTTEQNLQWTCTVEQTGSDVTFTFVVNNAGDFVGLVPVIWDNSDGFHEYVNRSSITFTGCTVGQVLKVAAKWMYAGGDTHTDYVEYTVVAAGDNGNNNENENENTGGNGGNGGKTQSGTTEQNLQWTCTVEQTGSDVTFTFVVNNAGDFVGLVPVIWDNSDGFHEYVNRSSITFTGCTAGQVLKVAAKWMYAGGDTHTEYVEYTVVENAPTSVESISTTVVATKIIREGKIFILREGHLYDTTGRLME